ncbi:hypothetical protein D917_04982 [Trichinella nativa]|uniref:Uncharacterized protein n=1 Tax=Trichinella nativa TaxID=6335 RepID=A0A1Y3F1I1_9BILA|nr:hypothetical protein D917_04982 [Trichinella nativa]
MNLFLLSIYAIFSLSFVHAEEFFENAEDKIEVNISENQSKDFPEIDDQSEKSLEIQDMENADFQEQESVERSDGVAETVKADEDDQQLTTDERQIVAEAPSEKPLSSESEESSDESEELIYSPEDHNETFYDALTDTDDVLDLEFHDALCGSSVDPPTDSQEKFPCPTPRPVV